MSILIFGGTTEGRLLAQELSQKGIPVTVSVATAVGGEELAGLTGVSVLIGRKNQMELTELVAQFDRCVDATHPYAVEATKNIAAACEVKEIPLRRLLRGKSDPVEGVFVDSVEQAAEHLTQREGNILLAIGAKGISAFGNIGRNRLFPRVLPVVESLLACAQAGIPTRNIIAMYGPFSKELNEGILRQFAIHYVVTKDGGAAGGFLEKAAAAKAVGTELIVIGRPPETGDDFESVRNWLAEEGQTWT